MPKKITLIISQVDPQDIKFEISPQEFNII